MGGKDTQLRPIFGNGAARDGNAAFPEHLLQSGIGVGLFGRLTADDLGQKLFRLRVGDGWPRVLLPAEGGGKEVAQRNRAVGSAHIFVGDGAANGGFVDSDGLGYFAHGQGVKGGGTVREVVGLAEGDDFEKFLQSLLASLEGVEKKTGGADSLLQVGAGVFVGGFVAEQIFVGVADTKAGKKISFDLGNPAVAVLDEGGFRPDDEIGSIGGEGGAGSRGESRDGFGGGLNRLERGGGGGGDFGKFSLPEKVEVMANDLGLEGVLLPLRLELEKECLWQGPGGDAWGVKGLDEGEGLVDLSGSGVGGGGNFGEVGSQESILVEVADDFGGSGLDGGFDLGEGELGGEVIGQGFGVDTGFDEGLAGVESGPIDPRGVDGPIGVAGREVGVFFFLRGEFGGFGGAQLFLQDGIRLQFSLEEIFKFERGGLEKLERLLDLGGDRDRLAQAGLERQRHEGFLDWAFSEKRQKVIWPK